MNANVQTALLLSFALRFAAIIAGGLMAVLGYRLYLRGLRAAAGRVEAAWGDKKFVLENAVPGSFLVVLGAGLILAALLARIEAVSPDWRIEAEIPEHQVLDPTKGGA